MNKIAYIVSKSWPRVERELECLNLFSKECSYESVLMDNLKVVLEPGFIDIIDVNSDKSILDFDLVYCRAMGGEEIRGAVGMLLSHANKNFINEEVAITQYTSKLWQYMKFSIEGLPFPRTVVASGRSIKRGKIDFPHGGPMVVKSTRGSNGLDNYLLNTLDEFSGDDETLYCIQEFIPNQFDYRIIVAEDEILLAYKRLRQSKDTHMNNIKQGGKREIVEQLSDETKALAIRAGKVLKRNLSGVDVLVANDGSEYLLEVNFNYGVPMFEGEIWHEYISNLGKFFNRKASS